MTPRQAIEYAPVASSVLFGSGHAGQLVRMWTQRTSAGQSLAGWLAVLAGLLLYVAYYRHKRLAVPLWATAASALLCASVACSVAWFRWLA